MHTKKVTRKLRECSAKTETSIQMITKQPFTSLRDDLFLLINYKTSTVRYFIDLLYRGWSYKHDDKATQENYWSLWTYGTKTKRERRLNLTAMQINF